MSEKAEDKYYAKCLQADLKSALKVILPLSATSKKVRALQNKVRSRFVEQNEPTRVKSKDPFIKDVVRIYRTYYRQALLNPSKVEIYNKELYANLKIALSSYSLRCKDNSPEKVEQTLSKEFRKRGYYSLFGAITPLRSLLVWKTQSQKIYSVSLPEKKQKVKVIFLEDFVELSWLHYATFGKYYVGGWAKKDALYCVKQAYKVDSPTFIAHYLSHEAQHFADYKTYPKLKQADLEYRAKLTELAVSRNPQKLITKLENEAKDDKRLPHCFAAYKIVTGLNLKVSRKQLGQDASALLAKHSQLLKRQGAKKALTAFS